MISEPLRNPLSLFDVKGKSAIVTGATGAFGRATAITLSALGGKVTIAGSNTKELEAVAEECDSVGGEVCMVPRRPDTLEDAQAMLDAALKAFGRVDQLVVGSGYNKAGFIQDLSLDDWQAVMDANVRGPWFMAKVVGGYWIKEKVKGQGRADVVRARPPRQHLRLHRLLRLEGRDGFADARARD